MIYSSQLIDYCVIKGLVDSTFSSLSVQGPPPLLPALFSQPAKTIGVSAHGSEFGPPGFPRNARIQRVRQAITDAARAPPITSSARLTLLENESETESSTTSLPALLPPFDITTGFQLGISSKDPTAGDGKGDKKARRRPPSGNRKMQVRAVGTARNSTQNEENNRENGAKGNIAVEYFIELFMSSNPVDLESLFEGF
ncbi:hypothetical protein F2Q68_00029963 [Brassica cretica]|uniref:Uncharacterized protein n=1 Tax=Brassica cretica TaxID=69181 RepID=A0A8S9G8L1_BRACR|nr:hypothetical protein F2Q68_00029963 [Brassica cretica]